MGDGAEVWRKRRALPAQPTALVGRERELRAVQDRLLQAEVRLLTLTGPGGTGKTRLALASAAALSDEFGDGVAFIDLSALLEPDLVASTILQALEVPERGGEVPLEALTRALHSRHQLLVLDNFEQLLPVAPLLAELLSGCPKLKLLVTSRAALKLRWEHLFPVPPLTLPDLTRLPELEALREVPAVSLFVKRALAVQPDFTLSAENARAVAGICHHLDGLPLALELAAPRLKLFSPQELLGRLERRLDFVQGRVSDLPTRQQTLHAEINWSYGLLSEAEQALFRRLGVFVGGFSAEAVQAVCGDEVEAVLGGLEALVDQSLLQVERTAEGVRFRMLLTLRAFALERLAETPEEKARVEEAHRHFYFRLLHHWGAELQGAHQQQASKVLEQELENIRAAWNLVVTNGHPDALRRSATFLRSHYERAGRYREGMQLLNQAKRCLDEVNSTDRVILGEVLINQAWLWFRLGNYDEALRLARFSLALLRPLEPDEVLTEVLFTLGAILRRTGDYTEAKRFLEEGLALARRQGNALYTARTLNFLALVEQSLGHYVLAQSHYEEALAIHRHMNDHALVATILNNLGNMLVDLGRADEARALLMDGVKLAREYGFRQTLPYLLSSLGSALYELGAYASAVALNQEALELVRQSGERWVEAFVLTDLGRLALASDDHTLAQSHFQQSLHVAWNIKSLPMALRALVGTAEVKASQTQSLEAVNLLLCSLHHSAISKVERDRARRLLADLEHRMHPEVFAHAFEAGTMLNLDVVVQDVLAQGVAVSRSSAPTGSSSVRLSLPKRCMESLTERETEVLKFVSQGLTNKGIASTLGISEKTVARHLENIFNKLGVSSRAAATAFAVREGLLPDRRTGERG